MISVMLIVVGAIGFLWAVNFPMLWNENEPATIPVATVEGCAKESNGYLLAAKPTVKL
jgi:hypothetical protein